MPELKNPTRTAPSTPVMRASSVTVLPLYPIAGEVVDEPLTHLIWRDTAADAYQVQVATDESFINVSYSAIHVENQAHVPCQQLSVGAEYFWRVRARKDGRWGPFSEPACFRSGTTDAFSRPRRGNSHITVPTPIAPSGNAPVDTAAVPLSWSVVPGARTYQIQVATEPGFMNPEVNLPLPPSTSLTLFNLLTESEAPLFWRVRSETTAGWGDWSTISRFRAVPEAIAAANEMQQQAARAEGLQIHARWEAQQAPRLPASLYRSGVTSKGEVLLMLLTMVLTLVGIASLLFIAILR